MSGPISLDYQVKRLGFWCAVVALATGVIALALIPTVAGGGLASSVGFQGAEWLWPILVPLIAAALAFVATRAAAARRLKEAG